MSFHCQFLSSEPLPSTLIPDFSFLTTPVSTNKAGVTSVPSSNLLSWSKLTIAYSLRLMLVKPRLVNDGIKVIVHLQIQVLRHHRTCFLTFCPRPLFYRYQNQHHVPRTRREPSAAFNSCNFIYRHLLNYFSSTVNKCLTLLICPRIAGLSSTTTELLVF